MLHPSYSDLMAVVNSEVEPGEAPVVNSRYSIVLATAKRARQIIDGAEPLVDNVNADDKPLSVAIAEVHKGETKILTEEEAVEYAKNLEEALALKAAAEKAAAEKAAAEEAAKENDSEQNNEENVENTEDITTDETEDEVSEEA